MCAVLMCKRRSRVKKRRSRKKKRRISRRRSSVEKRRNCLKTRGSRHEEEKKWCEENSAGKTCYLYSGNVSLNGAPSFQKTM